jgi:ABC-type metal ion transport system substrate-binding protein
MNITNSWYLVNQAIKEADRLKQKSISQMPYTNYMVVRDEDNYVVQMFNYPARDQAIKNGNLLYITR